MPNPILIQPPPSDDSTWTMWVIAGLGAIFSVALTAICLWVNSIKYDLIAYIGNVKSSSDKENENMRGQINDQNEKQQATALNNKDVYATKTDLEKMEVRMKEDMQEKFDSLHEGLEVIKKFIMNGHYKP